MSKAVIHTDDLLAFQHTAEVRNIWKLTATLVTQQ